MIFVVALFSLGIANALADPVPIPETVIYGEAPRSADRVSLEGESTRVATPSLSPSLGSAISLLPGTFVRSYSGPGSLTSAASPAAYESSGTPTSVDQIPIADPKRLGLDYSFFPPLLFDAVELQSAFIPATENKEGVLLSPGGRLNLETARPHGEPGLQSRGSLLTGSGKLLSGTFLLSGLHAKDSWTFGLSGMNAEGTYAYKDPVGGQDHVRENNDAIGGGVLGSYRHLLGERGSVSVLEMGSLSDRANPGSLTAPLQEREKDEFNATGARLEAPDLFAKNAGLLANASVTYSRNLVRDDATGTSDTHTVGTFAELAHTREGEAWGGKWDLLLEGDQQHQEILDSASYGQRDLWSLSQAFGFERGALRWQPLVREETGQEYGLNADGMLALRWAVSKEGSLSLGYGYLHELPSVAAKTGYNVSGFTVLPNPGLQVERTQQVSVTGLWNQEKWSGKLTWLGQSVMDRTVYVSVGPTGNSAQYVNLPFSATLAAIADLEWRPWDFLSARTAITVQRAWDTSTGQEIAFKPNLFGLASISWMPLHWISMTVEEQWVSRRLTQSTGVDALSPFAQTNLRASFGFGDHWELSAQMINLFDAAGYVTTGYPYLGQNGWLGLSWKG